MLSAEQLKTLLPGALVRYENAENATSVKLNTDGSLNGRTDRRIGGSGGRNPGYEGEWTITEEGRWTLGKNTITPLGTEKMTRGRRMK